jgi:RNA polymerase sigma factor (TIGR02999 family)
LLGGSGGDIFKPPAMTTGRHDPGENFEGGPAVPGPPHQHPQPLPDPDPGPMPDAVPEAYARHWLPGVYAELRRLATARLDNLPPGQTLQPTAIVHEAFLRLVEREQRIGKGWENRAHFFFAAGRAIHDVLVEHARAKARLKRGGGRKRLDPDLLTLAADAPAEELLALHDVLGRLERDDPAMHRMVMLRFFAGLGPAETADLLGTPLRTFERQWRFAKSWLRRELAAASADIPDRSE